MWNELYSAGIVKDKDMFLDDGQLMDLNAFCTQNDIKLNFPKTIGIRRAIPKKWIIEISQQVNNRLHETQGFNFTIKDKGQSIANGNNRNLSR